jgi:hypothetical protein
MVMRVIMGVIVVMRVIMGVIVGMIMRVVVGVIVGMVMIMRVIAGMIHFTWPCYFHGVPILAASASVTHIFSFYLYFIFSVMGPDGHLAHRYPLVVDRDPVRKIHLKLFIFQFPDHFFR